MNTTLADPLVGRLLDGRYQVEALVAKGGMATVYRAIDTRLDRRVALKVMHADLARDEDFVNRFIGEAKSVARLSHPNVVSVYDQGRDGPYLYLAMEYLPGRTLRDLLGDRGRFPPREALSIMVPLLSGLAAAHTAGIVHRDVKPENVLIAPDGHLKVVDFGLARALSVSSQTRTGVIIGTVAYLAPEQVRGTGTDARTDVYAAGVVLFELLTGTKPHTGDSPLAVAYKHVNETVPAPSRFVPGIPPEVDRLVAKATSRDPRGRPAGAAEFLQLITGVMRGLPADGEWAGGGWAASAAAWPGTGSAASDVPGYGAAGYRAPGYGGEHHTQILGSGGDGQTVIAGHDELDGYGGSGGYRRKRRAGLLAAVAAGIFAVAGAAGWWFTQAGYTNVPAVAGMTDGAAVTALRSDGFTVRMGAAVTDNNARAGTVVRTVPTVGGRIHKGAAITLIPSAGPRMIKVPDVAGQQLADAQQALRNAGLTPGQVRKVASDSVDAGIVVGTQPAAGLSSPQPTPVVITVSEGPPLPNFVGQDQQSIQQWAAQNGITLNIQQDTGSSQPQGTITRQSPAAGTPITDNETVTIGVSAGPPQVTIPNVDGMSVGQARQTLMKLGFSVTVNRFGPFNKVFSYSPDGQAPKGSTVTLYTGF
jgi:beta-lactam-binding protein with PASTA domain/tRNA A-37 threonylcarbamoyl transferase component Bud32